MGENVLCGMKEYIHESSGIVVRDEGEGRVTVVCAANPQNNGESRAEGEWVRDTLKQIAAGYEKPISMLVDLMRVESMPYTDQLRAFHRDTIEEGYIERVAVVGDAFIFTRVLAVVSMLSEHRKKIKFFFKMEDAKDWLGW